MAMFSTKEAKKLHKEVPPDWYESSVKDNVFQRFWHRRRFEEVEKKSEKIGGEILDVGSADGYFTNEILRQTGANKVVGIDVLDSSVSYANKRYKQNKKLKFQVADGHNLPFKERSFNAVYCLEAMEHVYSPEKVIREIFRVLKPGGYTIVLVPAENTLFKIVWWLWTKWRGRIWKDTHLHHFDHQKLHKILMKRGFGSIESKRFILGMLLLIKAKKI